jgi:hypothetical protein
LIPKKHLFLAGFDVFKRIALWLGWRMGPAQFIPSTGTPMMKKFRCNRKTSHPWSINDAFLGAALLLKE